MSKLFQEIIALMLYANIKFELNHGINNAYYLVRLKGDEIVWEIDDHPDDDKDNEIAKQYYLNSTIGDKTPAWQLVDESENVPSQNTVWLYLHNSSYGFNYTNLKNYIESITQTIDTYKTS